MKRLLYICLFLLTSQSSWAVLQGANLQDCVAKMAAGDWCELTGSEPKNHFLTKDKVKPYTWGWTGVKSIIEAWTGMATDGRYYYITGGGHADYGGNEMYRYDPVDNIGIQITEQSNLTHWFQRGKDEDDEAGKNRYCRIPNTHVYPSSTHTYDGIEYNKPTNEIIVGVYGAANHSCVVFNINDEPERFAAIEPLLISPADTGGIYALSLDTLTWRKLITRQPDGELFIRTEIRGSDGMYFFGGRNFTYYGKIEKDKPLTILGKSQQLAQAGDGVLVWDKARQIFWSEHKILAWKMDANAKITGRVNVPADTIAARAWVIDESNNQLIKWNGSTKISVYTPETDTWCDEISANGREYPTGRHTSAAAWTLYQTMQRVYTKFKYIAEHDVFIGVNQFNKPWLLHKRSHVCGLKRVKIEEKITTLEKQTLVQRIIQSKKNDPRRSHEIRIDQKKLTLAQRIKRMEKKRSLDSKEPLKKREQKVITSRETPNKKAWSLNPSFGGLSDLQLKGLLPKYGLATHTVQPDTNINWGGSGGERDEIGLFPEQHAAFIAGQADLKDSILEAALLPPPDNKDHAHAPNEFWLPYLLTANPVYVTNMERSWYLYKRRYKGQALDSAIVDSYARLIAWNLRELTQLAYLESKGLTKETVYIKSLNATRDRWLGIIANPRADQAMFNVLDFNSAGVNSHGFTGWMQSMLGQAINYTAYMTKDEGWKTVAAWHFQNLLKSSGDKWPLKALGYSHVFMYYFMEQGNKATRQEVFDFAQTATWDTVRPWPYAALTDQYLNLDPNHIAPKEFRTPASIYTMVYTNRFHYSYAWARLACYNEIERACEKADQIQQEVDAAGYWWSYKNGVIVK
ncbi:MAG: hypothetical protein COB26_02865 [Piscirickettsiaceae bacterium]|nr:MAG: hypothetical protein COB26_02865 [Piscirickettsiaceae bacterium]